MVGSLLVFCLLTAPQAPVATTTTATTAALPEEPNLDDLLGDLPLSEEELALVEALDETKAATVATPLVPIWPAPEPAGRTVAALRLEEPAAPTVWEALGALPIITHTIRTASTAQTVLLYDLPLDGDTAWLALDPRFFASAHVQSAPDLRPSSRTDAAVLTLKTRPVPERGTGFEGAVTARSNDRSLQAFADAYAAAPQGGLRGTVSVVRRAPIRIQSPGESEEVGPALTRIAGRLEGRLFGTPQDAFGLRAGGLVLYDDATCLDDIDCDRAVGAVTSPQPGTQGNGLGFVRADLRSERVSAFVLGAYRTQWTDTDDTQGGIQTRAGLEYRPYDNIRLELGTLTGHGPNLGSRWEGMLAFESQWTALTLEAAGRVFHRAFEGERDAVTELLPQLRATVQLGPNARIWGGWTLGVHDHPLFGQSRLFPPTWIATSWTGDVGTQIAWDTGWWQLRGYGTLVNEGCLDARSRDRGSTDNGLRLTLESEGTWRFAPGVSATMGAAWTEQDDGLCRLAVARLRGIASLRYDYGTRAFVQTHILGMYDGPRLGNRLPTPGFLRIGLTGGVELGGGFHFRAVLENVFDQEVYLSRSLTAGAGLDLRAHLSYRL